MPGNRIRQVFIGAGRSPVSPAALVIIALTVGMMALTDGPLSSDLSAQLWIAHQIRSGTRLYIDIAEINPPLWFWAAIPLDWLAEITSIRSEVFAVGAVGAAILASLVATSCVPSDMPPERYRLLMIYAALLLFIMPIRDIGQREHYALIWALPYVVLAAARRQGKAVSWPVAMAIGGVAGLGFALKHYFLGVPILIELWLLCSLRRGWRPVRAETLALALAGLGYATAVVILTPGYLNVMVPILQLAYGPSASLPWRVFLLPGQLVSLFLLGMIALKFSAVRGQSAPITTAMLIAAAGFLMAFVVQGKGWPYHAIPTIGFVALAYAACLFEKGNGRRPDAILALPLLLPLALALIPTQSSASKDMQIDPVLTGLNRGDPVALISTEGLFYWPNVADRGFRFPARYLQYWMLASIESHAAGDHDPRAVKLAETIVSQTVKDFICLPPRRIIFLRTTRTPGAPITQDPMSFFMRDAEFADVMRHYRLWKRQSVFDAYELVMPFTDRPLEGCRAAPI